MSTNIKLAMHVKYLQVYVKSKYYQFCLNLLRKLFMVYSFDNTSRYDQEFLNDSDKWWLTTK